MAYRDAPVPEHLSSAVVRNPTYPITSTSSRNPATNQFGVWERPFSDRYLKLSTAARIGAPAGRALIVFRGWKRSAEEFEQFRKRAEEMFAKRKDSGKKA